MAALPKKLNALIAGGLILSGTFMSAAQEETPAADKPPLPVTLRAERDKIHQKVEQIQTEIKELRQAISDQEAIKTETKTVEEQRHKDIRPDMQDVWLKISGILNHLYTETLAQIETENAEKEIDEKQAEDNLKTLESIKTIIEENSAELSGNFREIAAIPGDDQQRYFLEVFKELSSSLNEIQTRDARTQTEEQEKKEGLIQALELSLKQAALKDTAKIRPALVEKQEALSQKILKMTQSHPNKKMSDAAGVMKKSVDLIKNGIPAEALPAQDEAVSLLQEAIAYDLNEIDSLKKMAVLLEKPADPAAANKPDELAGARRFQLPDLTSHPLAGTTVEIEVMVKDALNQTGVSKKIQTRLPQRDFKNPLAPVFAHIRWSLTDDTQKSKAMASLLNQLNRKLDAAFISPENLDFLQKLQKKMAESPDPQTQYQSHLLYRLIGAQKDIPIRPATLERLHDIHIELAGARDDEQLAAIVQKLWDIMLQLEEDIISPEEQALRDAEKALREAIERGAKEEELKKLREELRKAMENALKDKGDKADRQGDEESRKAFEDMQKLMEQMRQVLEDMRKMNPDLAKMMDQMQARQMQKMAQQMQQNQNQSQMQQNMQNMMQRMQQMAQQMQQMQKMQQQIQMLQKMIEKQEKLRQESHQSEQQRQKEIKPDLDKIWEKIKEVTEKLNKDVDQQKQAEENARPEIEQQNKQREEEAAREQEQKNASPEEKEKSRKEESEKSAAGVRKNNENRQELQRLKDILKDEEKTQKDPQQKSEKDAQRSTDRLNNVHKRLNDIKNPQQQQSQQGQGQNQPQQQQQQQQQQQNDMMQQLNQMMQDAKKKGNSAQRQDIKERQNQLQQQLQDMMQQMQQQQNGNMQQAQNQMQQAQDQLDKGTPGEAGDNQQQAKNALEKASQELKQQMQKQAQQMQQQMGGNPGQQQPGQEGPGQGQDPAGGGQQGMERAGESGENQDGDKTDLGRSNPNESLDVDPTRGLNQSREIRDAIRQRLEDLKISPQERDYLQRLLNDAPAAPAQSSPRPAAPRP